MLSINDSMLKKCGSSFIAFKLSFVSQRFSVSSDLLPVQIWDQTSEVSYTVMDLVKVRPEEAHNQHTEKKGDYSNIPLNIKS